jgi:hypothetical protein
MLIRKSRVAARASLVAVAVVMSAIHGAGPAAALACPAPLVFTVLNTNDSGMDSLRQAIVDTNANVNVPGCPADAIEFNIAGLFPHFITLVSGLPKINDPVNIRGYTQPGSLPAVALVPATINIWIDATNAKNGLVVETHDSSISGLVIGNAGRGVVGGDGVGIKVTGDNNRVRGNHIGTHQPIAAPPSFLQGTRGDGIKVTGNGNEIGSSAAEDRNVIAASGLLAGTDAYGVRITGNGNAVQGNTIGTDPDVTTDQIGNGGGGVDIVSGEENVIGGTVAGAGNLISGNAGPAIHLEGPATKTGVFGNTIGDVLGMQNFYNSRGVVIEEGSTKNIIGSPAELGGNLIANISTGPGIELNGDENLVLHNTIGVDEGQTTVLPNKGGIKVTGNLNIIGGDAPKAGNVVSGNDFYGISLDDRSDPQKAIGNIIWGNYIGTDATDTNILGNDGDGIRVLGGDLTKIGGSGGAGFKPNVIANNTDAGVGVGNGTHNSIVQNRIYGNGELGIDLNRDGLVLANDNGDSDAGPNGLQNHPLITAVTTTAFGVATISWNATSFLTDPSETTEIDFYKSDTCDDSGNGQGQTLIGTASLGPGALPASSSTVMFLQRVSAGQFVTAIATSGVSVPTLPGRTSEFSPCFQA